MMCKQRLRSRFIRAIVLGLVPFCMVGCFYIMELRAFRFEPLSTSLEGEETKVKRDWKGWSEGSPHRELVVLRDGIDVRVSAFEVGSPGTCHSANVFVEVRNETGEPLRIVQETVEFRPHYKREDADAPAVLHPRVPDEDEPENPEFIETEGRFTFRFGETFALPKFKKAEVDFTLVRGNGGPEYRYRFHLKKD